jgi:hypothetical protein
VAAPALSAPIVRHTYAPEPVFAAVMVPLLTPDIALPPTLAPWTPAADALTAAIPIVPSNITLPTGAVFSSSVSAPPDLLRTIAWPSDSEPAIRLLRSNSIRIVTGAPEPSWSPPPPPQFFDEASGDFDAAPTPWHAMGQIDGLPLGDDWMLMSPASPNARPD